MTQPIVVDEDESRELARQWKEDLADMLRTAYRESDPYVKLCIDSFQNCGAGYATCGAIAYVIKHPVETRADWQAATSAERYLYKLHALCKSDGDTVTHLGRMPFIVRQRIKKLTGSDDLTK
jgi:hypothetical protein